MINFFRKIRWRLAQNNQFFKYSRYAIGEIVLVVVGILIALQINNWNEGRQDNRKKQVYLLALERDLKKDTLQIRLFLEELDRYEPHYKEMRLTIEKEDTTIDTLINLFSTSTNYTPYLEPINDSAINSLLSTGDIKLIDQNQLSELLNFYEETELYYENINDWYIRTMEINEQFWNNFGWLTKSETNWFMYQRARKSIDEVKFSIDYDVYVTKRFYFFPYMRDYSQLLLEKTNKMLKTIQHMKR